MPYTMKLEGASSGPYQTIMLIGIQDPEVLADLVAGGALLAWKIPLENLPLAPPLMLRTGFTAVRLVAAGTSHETENWHFAIAQSRAVSAWRSLSRRRFKWQ